MIVNLDLHALQDVTEEVSEMLLGKKANHGDIAQVCI